MRMRFWAAALTLSFVTIAGCQNRVAESSAPAALPAAVAPGQPEYKVTATIKDLMVTTVNPLTDIVWNSVATIVTPAGTEERRPKTDEEWQAVMNAATTVMETANLLQMPRSNCGTTA